MSDDYTRRDYAEDDPNSVQSKSVSGATNERKTGPTHKFHELYEPATEETPGHDSDEEAVSKYSGGSRDTREPTDKADELAAKWEDF